jgi:transposase
MEGVLCEYPRLMDFSPDLTALVAKLRQEVAELRAEAAEVPQVRDEVARLRGENLELRQQVGYWKGMHAQALRRLEQLQQEVEQLRGENAKLQAQLFGRKSEKQSSRDRSNHLEGEEEEPSSKKKRGQQSKNPGPKRRDYSHLTAVDEPLELPEAQRTCPKCGQTLSPSDAEESEVIEIEVRPYRRKIRRRRYRRTCSCEGCPRTLTAPAPPKLIPKGRLGVSVWAEILLDKYFSHRPTERLLAQWQLVDLDLAAGTVADGLRRLEPLFKPLYEALLTRNVQSAYMQADETRWLVFIEQEGKKGHCWWLWVFLGQDTVAYRLDPHRSHDVPEGHFPAEASLVLMVDRYSAYKAMAQVKAGFIVLVFCWAHVRRDFVQVGKGWLELKTWAVAWLRRIRELYRLQRQRLAQPADSDAFAAADAGLRQAITAMQNQAAAELLDPQLREPCRKVLASLQEHWTGLTRFVDDLRIPMDNNASERRARGPAVGRKNYYGSGALWSGRLAAMLFSLFATLQLWKLNPRRWLRWYLQSCAEAGGQAPADITPFLPWNLSSEQRTSLAADQPPESSDTS